MKILGKRHRATRTGITALAAAVLAATGSLRAQPMLVTTGSEVGLPMAASPGSEGFSKDRLERINAFLSHEVDAHEYAGAVWLVARDGNVVSHGAVGFSDLAARKPMSEGSVFAIMSMTKLITTVTALSLWEEGRFNMDDPIANYLPELANPKIYVSGTADAPVLIPAKRKITIRNLLTQTSGYTYGFFETDPAPVKQLYAKSGIFASATLPEFVSKAATLPLLFEPGHAWNYGINTDLVGALIEKLTGKPLGTVMKERVFGPLKMTDTGFSPPKDAARLAKAYRRNLADRLVEVPPAERAPVGGFQSGGGGLYSTLHDYARFAQMLLNHGEFDGQRILGRKTVDYMTTDQLGNLEVRRKGHYIPAGFGLGVRVRLDNAADYETLGSPGEYGWEGILTTYVSIDPAEKMFMLLLTQHKPFDEHYIFESFTNVTYQALEK